MKEQSRGCSGMKSKDILSWTSSLIVPLMLGAFTVYITIQQQNSARQQRIEDRIESFDQRKEQLLIAKEDRDNQIKITISRYQDEVLMAYIQEMGELLEKVNGTLPSDSIKCKIARAKTLNALRQLDGLRSSHLIRFLYETGQLTTTASSNALDLSTAELTNISKKVLLTDVVIGALSLKQTIIRNSSLTEIWLNNLDLSFADISFVDFSFSKLTNIGFIGTVLKEVVFYSYETNRLFESCKYFDYVQTDFGLLKNIDFTNATLHRIDIQYVSITESRFTKTNLRHVQLTSTMLDKVHFDDSILIHVDFSKSQLIEVHFNNSEFENVDFSNTELHNVDFTDCDFVNVTFSSSKMYNVSFRSALFLHVNFTSATMIHTDFQQAELISTSFSHLRRFIGRMELEYVEDVNFSMANLKDVQLSGIDLRKVDFFQANLRRVSFNHTVIDENLIRRARSVHDARLPNGTLARDPNLIRDGYDTCRISSENGWTIEQGHIHIEHSTHDEHESCRFVLSTRENSAVMSQTVLLSPIWNPNDWPSSYAQLRVTASDGVIIEVAGLTSKGQIINQLSRSGDEKHSLRLNLHNRMDRLLVRVQMLRSMNTEKVWCEKIEMTIDYGTEFECQSDMLIIPRGAQWSSIGVDVAGGHGIGSGCDQLGSPAGIAIDDEGERMLITEQINHRVISWNFGENFGSVVAGGHGEGSGLHQFNLPTDVVIDKEMNSILVCDYLNYRIMRWSLRFGTSHGELMADQIGCHGLAIDANGTIYVTDIQEHAIVRYSRGSRIGVVVAGGAGRGDDLNQFNQPMHVALDNAGGLYVTDYMNHRIMKWIIGRNESFLVVSGQSHGKNRSQLWRPAGLVVDSEGSIYIVESGNRRVTRWRIGAKEGESIVSLSDDDKTSIEKSSWVDLAFDRYGNLYVVDGSISSVKRFNMTIDI